MVMTSDIAVSASVRSDYAVHERVPLKLGDAKEHHGKGATASAREAAHRTIIKAASNFLPIP